jgi:hypothetical protein
MGLLLVIVTAAPAAATALAFVLMSCRSHGPTPLAKYTL